METKTIKKDCQTCLYLATYEKCKGCLGMDEPFQHTNWVEGDGVARIKTWEQEGQVNIVIGGMGEAEVNVKWTPEEALKSLCHVAECCGYSVYKGDWYSEDKKIHCWNEVGHFVLCYYKGKLEEIKQFTEKVVWKKKEGTQND